MSDDYSIALICLCEINNNINKRNLKTLMSSPSSLCQYYPILFQNREAYTLQLLNKFKSKLTDIKSSNNADDDNDNDSKANKASTNDVNDEELNSDKWMVNVLEYFRFFLSAANNVNLIAFCTFSLAHKTFIQSHTLKFEEMGNILAKDASTKRDDWYENDIANPQNPINKRKRGEDGRRDKKDRNHRR